MKNIIATLGIAAAVSVGAPARSEAQSYTPATRSPFGDSYILKCPDNAFSGCTLTIAAVLPGGVIHTTQYDVMPGHEENILWTEVVTSQTTMVPN